MFEFICSCLYFIYSTNIICWVSLYILGIKWQTRNTGYVHGGGGTSPQTDVNTQKSSVVSHAENEGWKEGREDGREKNHPHRCSLEELARGD